MNNIVTIYDKIYNGKTGKKIYKEYHKKYDDCILNFENNTRINYKKLHLHKNILFYQKKILNIKNINIFIFNYNEDNILHKNYLKKVIPIYNFLKNNFKHLHFFNNPLNHSIITDKLVTYKKLKKCKYVNIPLFGVVNNRKNIFNITKYPIIISKRKQSGGIGKYKINKKKEFDNYQDNFFKNKFWSLFYKSYLPDTEIFICIRFYIFNEKLIDFVCRPSLNWNVHTGNQLLKNTDIILKSDHFFSKYYKNNKKYIDNVLLELYSILGNGFYCHDFLLVNEKLILCELGYKILDPKLIYVHTKNNLLNILSYKICNNPDKVHNTYKNLILKYSNVQK